MVFIVLEAFHNYNNKFTLSLYLIWIEMGSIKFFQSF